MNTIYLHKDDGQYIPSKAGVYPVIIPGGIYSSNFIGNTKITQVKDPLIYCKSTYGWKPDDDLPCVTSSVTFSAMFRSGMHSRWLSAKPVVRASILSMSAGTSVIRSYLENDEYVDYETKVPYTVEHCGTMVSNYINCYMWNLCNETSYRYHPATITKEDLAVLQDLLNGTIDVSHGPPDVFEIQHALVRARWRGNGISYQKAVDLGILDKLPPCCSKKPFARGASFTLRVEPRCIVLSSDLADGTADLKGLEEYIQGTQQELLAELRHVSDSISSYDITRDSTGNQVWYLGLGYVKAVTRDKVLSRYASQDAKL